MFPCSLSLYRVHFLCNQPCDINWRGRPSCHRVLFSLVFAMTHFFLYIFCKKYSTFSIFVFFSSGLFSFFALLCILYEEESHENYIRNGF